MSIITKVHIRWWIRRDTSEVLDIEALNAKVPKSDKGFFEKKEKEFLGLLSQRDCIGMIAEVGDAVVGHMVYELHKKKLHILNLAVHPKYHRQGIGTQMVNKLKKKLSGHRRTRLTLEIRETLLKEQLFFKKMGFLAVQVMRNYYEDTFEDAFVMVYEQKGQEND